MLDKLLFGKDEHGLVFYRFGLRSRPHPVDMQQAAKLKSATLVTLIIVGILILAGLFFAVNLTLMIVFVGGGQGFGFDLRWLYLALLFQAALVGIVIFIYDRIIGGILRQS